MDFSFDQLRALSGDTDTTDVVCPACSGQARTHEGRKRKCLRIWDDGEKFISFSCARCGARGYVRPDEAQAIVQPKVKKETAPKKDKTAICQFLWDQSKSAIGTPAQVYLQSRQCCPAHMPHTIRFLDGREHKGKQYPPAMISRFGFAGDPLTGVHLTRLLPDGSGKFEGDGPSKITMGDTIGQPIVIYTNENDEGDNIPIVIAEGIEDIGSMVIATGWDGWAAGTAGRIAAVVATAVRRGYQQIYVAEDLDRGIWEPEVGRNSKGFTVFEKEGAGRRAIEKAGAVGSIIPLSLAGIVGGRTERWDANKILRTHGPEWLKAAMEWCALATTQFKAGISYEEFRTQPLPSIHQLNKKREPLERILFPAG